MSIGADKHKISLSIGLSESPDWVFKALTSVDELTKWLVPNIERIDSNDNKLKFIWPHNSFEVEFLETKPNQRVVMSWYHEKGFGPLISFTLNSMNNSTLVKFEHDSFSIASEHLDAYVGHVEGWTMYLCNLKCWVDYGKDLRADQLQGTIAM